MIPKEAICFYKDGNQYCCVDGRFENLQESPAGFGDTPFDAIKQLTLEKGSLLEKREIKPDVLDSYMDEWLFLVEMLNNMVPG